MLTDGFNTLVFHIACNDTRKCTAQISRECGAVLIKVQVQCGHILVIRDKRLLESGFNL